MFYTDWSNVLVQSSNSRLYLTLLSIGIIPDDLWTTLLFNLVLFEVFINCILKQV